MPLEPTNGPQKLPSKQTSSASDAKSEEALEREIALHEIAQALKIKGAKTNKTRERILTENAEFIATLPPAPCIKGWSQDRLNSYMAEYGAGFDSFYVAIPQDVADFLACASYPLSEDDALRLEATVAEYNGVPKECIVADSTIKTEGHADCHVPWKPSYAASQTGFMYWDEKESD